MYVVILSAIGMAVIAFLVVAAKQPADFRISRSRLVNAPPAAIFIHVNELKKWDAWSPWVKLDPNARNSFSGPAFGTGASMQWAGNSKVGVGSMTITESRDDEFIRLRLEFIKPIKTINTAEFRFRPEGEQTLVCWCMFGTNGFTGKVMGLIMNCDKMVGAQFEQGLANLKTLAEAEQPR